MKTNKTKKKDRMQRAYAKGISITQEMRDKKQLLFMSKVIPTPTCWIWNGKMHEYGYGQFYLYGPRVIGAHRASYVLFKGNVPDSMVVRHSCDNPVCVNPAHLELGTQRENVLDCVKRGRHPQGKKTHCPKGHPYAGENLAITKQSVAGKLNRVCRKCHANRQRLRQQRKQKDKGNG